MWQGRTIIPNGNHLGVLIIKTLIIILFPPTTDLLQMY